MTTANAPTLRLGKTEYPVVLPSVRDPRLHLASVIVTIHVLGQTSLGFKVSVPQILSAILTCAVIEVVWTFRKTRQIVWPASAMLTGSGVALILRIVGAERGDHWSWSGWYLFAAIAGFSLITKYVIRFRGSHVFNPSNFGLVVAFLVLGSQVIEPLDFWWSPLDPGMAAAYLIILVGGLLITARLRLLALAATFWIALAGGVGLLAASGHCMTTAWAFQPVCGPQFWWVIVTSPEVLIFLFFMITDPKTIPVGRGARIAFAACLGLTCALLIAPQTTEFGAKVGLLAGLVVLTPLRYLFDRFVTGSHSTGGVIARLATPPPNRGPLAVFARGAAVGSLVIVVAVSIVAAGAPARVTAEASTTGTPVVEVDIDPSTIPTVTIGADAEVLNSEIPGGAQGLALTLAENLHIEGEAMRDADTAMLRAANDGERLIEMERRIEIAATTGEFVVDTYTFDSIHVDVVFIDDDSQAGASLGFEVEGSVESVLYDANGAVVEQVSSPLETIFVMRPGADDRWLIVTEPAL